MRTFSFLSWETANGSNISPPPRPCKCTTKICLKAARPWERVTLEAKRYNDPLASWPFLLSGSASACSLHRAASTAACTEQAGLQLKSWLDHDPAAAAAAVWRLLTCTQSSLVSSPGHLFQLVTGLCKSNISFPWRNSRKISGIAPSTVSSFCVNSLHQHPLQ